MSYTIVGEQIQKYRKDKGLTQRELGEAIGVSSSAVSQWERGGTPDISLLPALSDTLGVTVDALFGRTEARREDMEETVAKYIASLPENKRLGQFAKLMRHTALYGCSHRVPEALDFNAGDSEITSLEKDGFVTAIVSGGQLFTCTACVQDGVFADLLKPSERTAQIFELLAAPNALTMLSKLYAERPRYRTAGVLAKLTGVPQSEAEAILGQFAELHLIDELELETESGSAKAYTIHLNGTLIPLLVSAQILASMQTEIRIGLDNRYGDKEEL